MTNEHAVEDDDVTPQDDLFAATERIRSAEFNSVPAEVLESVLRVEEANLDDRVTAAREVGRAIDAWLSTGADVDPATDAETAGGAMS